MIIDIVLLLLLVLAVIKGWQRGLIVAVFSFIAVVIGLAAAMKLSVVAAGYMRDSVSISAKWLPLVSFLVVFIAVVLLIRLAANVVQASVELAWLGWVNKLGGIVLYVIMHLLAFSVLLFFLVQSKMVSEKTINESVCYSYIEPWGPVVINTFGKLIPVFKDMFTELQNFFDNLAQKLPQSQAGM